jgi:hypothetical protein
MLSTSVALCADVECCLETVVLPIYGFCALWCCTLVQQLRDPAFLTHRNVKKRKRGDSTAKVILPPSKIKITFLIKITGTKSRLPPWATGPRSATPCFGQLLLLQCGGPRARWWFFRYQVRRNFVSDLKSSVIGSLTIDK